jgi:uncharacterized membrane protein
MLKGNWGRVILSILVVQLVAGLIMNLSYAASGIISAVNIAGVMGLDLDIPGAGLLWLLTPLSLVFGLLAILIVPVCDLGRAYIYIRVSRGVSVSPGDGFSKFPMFGRAFALNFMKWLLIMLWGMIPCAGFVFAVIAHYRFSMAFNILCDNPDISAMDALRRSKELTSGRKMDLFVLDLSFLGWALLCGVTLGIGFIFLMPYMGVTKAGFYNLLSGSPEMVKSHAVPPSYPAAGPYLPAEPYAPLPYPAEPYPDPYPPAAPYPAAVPYPAAYDGAFETTRFCTNCGNKLRGGETCGCGGGCDDKTMSLFEPAVSTYGPAPLSNLDATDPVHIAFPPPPPPVTPYTPPPAPERAFEAPGALKSTMRTVDRPLNEKEFADKKAGEKMFSKPGDLD